MRVEAFENAAVAAKAPTSKRVTRLKKENSAAMVGLREFLLWFYNIQTSIYTGWW